MKPYPVRPKPREHHKRHYPQYREGKTTQDGQLKPGSGASAPGLESALIDPAAVVTVLAIVGVAIKAIKPALPYIDRQLDRRAMLKMLDSSPEKAEKLARGLRMLRFSNADGPDEKPAVEAPKPPLSIEKPKPDAPPEDDSSKVV